MRRLLAALVFFVLAASVALAQSQPAEVVFPAAGLQLHGFLWKPDGPGPFPAILWNHGSEKLPGSAPALGAFYTAHSYVFFIPHRRGHGRSPGPYIGDLVERTPAALRARKMIEVQEAEVDDVAGALQFLKAQPFVDPARVAISGCSYGGIQTLLAGERNLGVTALVPFAPGAESWAANPQLGDRLRRAVSGATAPIFLIQASNDFSLEPSRVLGPLVTRKGQGSQAKVYPPYGESHLDGHARFCSQATDVWGNDVMAFLERTTPSRADVR